MLPVAIILPSNNMWWCGLTSSIHHCKWFLHSMYGFINLRLRLLSSPLSSMFRCHNLGIDFHVVDGTRANKNPRLKWTKSHLAWRNHLQWWVEARIDVVVVAVAADVVIVISLVEVAHQHWRVTRRWPISSIKKMYENNSWIKWSMKLCGSVSIHSFFVNREVEGLFSPYLHPPPTRNLEHFPQKN